MIKILRSGWLESDTQLPKQEVSVIKKYGESIVDVVKYPSVDHAITKINAGPLIPVKHKTKKTLELIGNYGFHFQCYLL